MAARGRGGEGAAPFVLGGFGSHQRWTGLMGLQAAHATVGQGVLCSTVDLHKPT